MEGELEEIPTLLQVIHGDALRVGFIGDGSTGKTTLKEIVEGNEFKEDHEGSKKWTASSVGTVTIKGKQKEIIILDSMGQRNLAYGNPDRENTFHKKAATFNGAVLFAKLGPWVGRKGFQFMDSRTIYNTNVEDELGINWGFVTTLLESVGDIPMSLVITHLDTIPPAPGRTDNSGKEQYVKTMKEINTRINCLKEFFPTLAKALYKGNKKFRIYLSSSKDNYNVGEVFEELADAVIKKEEQTQKMYSIIGADVGNFLTAVFERYKFYRNYPKKADKVVNECKHDLQKSKLTKESIQQLHDTLYKDLKDHKHIYLANAFSEDFTGQILSRFNQHLGDKDLNTCVAFDMPSISNDIGKARTFKTKRREAIIRKKSKSAIPGKTIKYTKEQRIKYARLAQQESIRRGAYPVKSVDSEKIGNLQIIDKMRLGKITPNKEWVIVQ